EMADVWRLLLAEAPDLVSELALVASAIEDLPRLLVEGPRRADGQPSPMVEQLLQGSPASASGIAYLCDAFEEFARMWPRGRPWGVLDPGAGTGGATGSILNLLAQSQAAFTYLATTADSEQAGRLGSLAESYVGVSACQWVPRDGNEALDGGPFDILLAVNA